MGSGILQNSECGNMSDEYHPEEVGRSPYDVGGQFKRVNLGRQNPVGRVEG